MTNNFGGWLFGQNSGSTPVGRRRSNQSLLAGQGLHLGKGLKLDKNRRISSTDKAAAEKDNSLDETLLRLDELEQGTSQVPLMHLIAGSYPRFMSQTKSCRFEDNLGPEDDGGSTTHYNTFSAPSSNEARITQVVLESTINVTGSSISSDSGKIRCSVIQVDAAGNELLEAFPYNGALECLRVGSSSSNRYRWTGFNNTFIPWSSDTPWTWSSGVIFALCHPETVQIKVKWHLFSHSNWNTSEHTTMDITDTILFTPALAAPTP